VHAAGLWESGNSAETGGVWTSVIRIALVLSLVMVVAGCGNATGTGDGPKVLSSGVPPGSTRPTWETSTSPPPAFLEAPSGRTELTVGSYCWSVMAETGGAGSCGDSLPFASYGNLATAQIADGDTVTLVLALIPSKPIEVSLGGDTTELPAAARSEWQPTGHGILEVFATFPQGNVSYGIRIAPDSG
jgi:hypothetical protein